MPVTATANAPAAAGQTYCPYVVTAHYASAYSQPSVHSRIFDAIPHGAQILASVSTVPGAGGPFRQIVGAGALAYVISDTLARRSGVCVGTDHRG